MNIRQHIEQTFASLLEEAGTAPTTALTDDLVLLQSGLDSLGFAILVARLEAELGFDPFRELTTAVYPRTFGEFVHLYEARAARTQS